MYNQRHKFVPNWNIDLTLFINFGFNCPIIIYANTNKCTFFI